MVPARSAAATDVMRSLCFTRTILQILPVPAEPRLWGNDGTAAQFLQFVEEFYGNKSIRLGVLHLGIAPITRADHAISGL